MKLDDEPGICALSYWVPSAWHGDPLCREIVDRFVETKKWRSQLTAKSETGAAKICESGLLDSLSCFIGQSGLADTLRLGRKNFSERRTVHLGVQLTPSERAELEATAAEAGTGLSQYVRELCLRRAPEASTVCGARRNPEAKRLVYELSAIGNNLNQLTHVANTVHATPQEHELKAMIEILKAAMARELAL